MSWRYLAWFGVRRARMWQTVIIASWAALLTAYLIGPR